MQRSVIQLAGKTLVVSMPSKWCREQGITKGGKVNMVIDGGVCRVSSAGDEYRAAITLPLVDEKNAWWAATAATPEVRRLLFDGRYRSVLVPSVEDSNSRSPDLNLAGRVGLWLSGRVDRWSCRLGSDWFSFNRSIDQEYLMAGHAHLRYLVSQVSLGASAFTIAIGHRNRDGSYSRVGREGLAPFLHLLGKGVIAPPAREQLASLSPVALDISHPTSRYLASAANGHGLTRYADTDLEPWAFGRLDCYWGMAPTPPADLSAVLWGRTRQFLNSSPASEFGFVAMLPAGVPTTDRSPWTNIWTTDGDHLTRDGQPLGPEAARASIRRDLEAGAGRFPFRIRGEVFWQVAAHGNGGYLITLVDPGYLDPGERRVELVPQSGRWRIRDRISGVELGPLGERMRVIVPAGTFLLLEAAPTP
jgi:hypothetical protein